MSKCSEIRDFCGDYAFDVQYSEDNEFTMFFNSRRNAETVKRCIEVDDSVPNVATAVDFVEVVRCKDCKKWEHYENTSGAGYCHNKKYCFTYDTMLDREFTPITMPDDFCSYGERKEGKCQEKQRLSATDADQK